MSLENKKPKITLIQLEKFLDGSEWFHATLEVEDLEASQLNPDEYINEIREKLESIHFAVVRFDSFCWRRSSKPSGRYTDWINYRFRRVDERK